MPFLIRLSRRFPVCSPGTRFGVRREKMYLGSLGSGVSIDLLELEQRRVVVNLFSPHAITDDLDAALDQAR